MIFAKHLKSIRLKNNIDHKDYTGVKHPCTYFEAVREIAKNLNRKA
jgi:hypothetical protein